MWRGYLSRGKYEEGIFINQSIHPVYFLFSVFSWPFPQDSELYAYIFPKLLYPLNNILLCCSIYVIIVIAFERLERTLSKVVVIIVIFLDTSRFVNPLSTGKRPDLRMSTSEFSNISSSSSASAVSLIFPGSLRPDL